MIKEKTVSDVRTKVQGELIANKAEIHRLTERNKELMSILGTIKLLEQESAKSDTGNPSSED